MNSKFFFLLSLGFLFIGIGCDDNDDVVPTAEYGVVLDDLTNAVIIATYKDLSNEANTLMQKIDALKATPTAQLLSEAKQSWVDTRAPWEKSEGFLFGPVDTEGIDPSIDSWPVNKVDLENVLAGNDPLTAQFVNSLEGTLKGFHTIEFLLWGGDGNKTIEAFTDREFDYLVATTAVLAEDTETLAEAWAPEGEDFGSNLMNAGESTSIYISQKAALEELANGILGIADEVGNGKINDPLEQEDLSLEESQFSDNSKTDFANNIRSIQNIYLGLNGQGLSSIIAEKNAELDGRVRAEIQAAIDAIEGIPGTFTEAIPADSPTRADAEFAQEAVRTLQSTLESEVVPFISNL